MYSWRWHGLNDLKSSINNVLENLLSCLILRQLPYKAAFSSDSGSGLSQHFHGSHTFVLVELINPIKSIQPKIALKLKWRGTHKTVDYTFLLNTIDIDHSIIEIIYIRSHPVITPVVA